MTGGGACLCTITRNIPTTNESRKEKKGVVILRPLLQIPICVRLCMCVCGCCERVEVVLLLLFFTVWLGYLKIRIEVFWKFALCVRVCAIAEYIHIIPPECSVLSHVSGTSTVHRDMAWRGELQIHVGVAIRDRKSVV